MKVDIYSDHFDNYFDSEAKKLSEERKETIPKQILFKLFSRVNVKAPKKAEKLSFMEKLFILWKALRSRVYIVIESRDGGMTIEQFFEFKEQQKKRNYSIGNAETLISTESFILGDKELCDTFAYLNNLSCSPAYKFLTQTKNTKEAEISIFRKQMNYVTKFLANYEATKKKMVMASGINVPEFLILMYLYDKEAVRSHIIHNSAFKYSYNSGRQRLKVAFSTLEVKRLTIRTGYTNNAFIQITPLGRNKVNEIMSKYFLNC